MLACIFGIPKASAGSIFSKLQFIFSEGNLMRIVDRYTSMKYDSIDDGIDFIETPVFTKQVNQFLTIVANRIYFLFAYKKNAQSDLTSDQIKILNAIVKEAEGEK